MSEFESYCNLAGIVAESVKERIRPHFLAGMRAGQRQSPVSDERRARIASEQMAAALQSHPKVSTQERAEWAVAAADALLRELAK